MSAIRSHFLPLCGAAFFAASGAGVAWAEEPAAESAPPATPAAVAESLAQANAEVAALREENAQLRLQIETLGLASLKPELRPLQERLIAALADYRLADQKVKQLTEQVVTLSESGLALLSDPADPAAKERLQTELTTANKVLLYNKTADAAPPVSLDSAKVISLKDDLGLAVINTGSESGLRLGTPMRIVRSEKTVATGLVVDVRNRVAGVLLTSANAAGALKVGDQAKPETISTLK